MKQKAKNKTKNCPNPPPPLFYPVTLTSSPAPFSSAATASFFLALHLPRQHLLVPLTPPLLLHPPPHHQPRELPSSLLSTFPANISSLFLPHPSSSTNRHIIILASFFPPCSPLSPPTSPPSSYTIPPPPPTATSSSSPPSSPSSAPPFSPSSQPSCSTTEGGDLIRKEESGRWRRSAALGHLSLCVPVIVSDSIELPFEEMADYSEFSVFVAVSVALRPNWLQKHFPIAERQIGHKMAEIQPIFVYDNATD